MIELNGQRLADARRERLGSRSLAVTAERGRAPRLALVAFTNADYNAGTRGDIDTSGGVDHLAAFAPVPGGIGPMTVSMLVERVIEMASLNRGVSGVKRSS